MYQFMTRIQYEEDKRVRDYIEIIEKNGYFVAFDINGDDMRITMRDENGSIFSRGFKLASIPTMRMSISNFMIETIRSMMKTLEHMKGEKRI